MSEVSESTLRISVWPPETNTAPRFGGSSPPSSTPTPTCATKWLTAYSGLPVANASPFAAETPTINAPARPGPAVTAIASTSSSLSCAVSKAARSVGTIASTWAREAISGITPPKRTCSSTEDATALASSVVPRTMPTPVSSQLVSIPRTTGPETVAAEPPGVSRASGFTVFIASLGCLSA